MNLTRQYNRDIWFKTAKGINSINQDDIPMGTLSLQDESGSLQAAAVYGPETVVARVLLFLLLKAGLFSVG